MAKMTIAQRREMVAVLCQRCGKRFQTKLPTRSKYCSLACRVRAFRANTRYKKWRVDQEAKATLIREQFMKEAKAHAEFATFDQLSDQLLPPILDPCPPKNSSTCSYYFVGSNNQ
jgi:hypothetical protein